MIVLLIILAIIILIALLRFGVALSYNEGGLMVWLRVGFLSFKLHPTEKKKVKKKKKMNIKALADLKPNNVKELSALASDVKSILSKVKKKILIKNLEIEYTAAGNDPSNTAILFGRANALLSLVSTVLRSNFRIKHSNCSILYDFESSQQRIKLEVVITIAVWEAMHLFFAVIPLVLPAQRASKTPNANRKEIKQNG